MSTEASPLTTLNIIIDQITQEWIQLQIVGHPLTPDEVRRSEALAQILEHLREAQVLLSSGAAPVFPEPTPLKDGLYTGGNGELVIELRVDEAVSGVISADVYRVTTLGDTWVASMRTNPGSRISLADHTWDIIGEDQQQDVATGQLTLNVQLAPPLTLSGSLRLDEPLAGIPGQKDIGFTATWTSDALRGLGIELEQEEEVENLPAYDFNGEAITIQTALAKAGIETFEVGMPSLIPHPPNEKGWGTTELHALMQDHAQASLARSAWEVHVLLLARPTRARLLGIMFDTTANLPRQGSAVFGEEIRQWAGANFTRKIIQTTVHEVGHALNLAHRFERELGRADSVSFMNYDWRYRGGGRQQEFWSKFDFSFDPDELEFLRHAPRTAVIPGGREFHSVHYWSEGGGGYKPYYPEVRITDLELKLTGPTAGLVFNFLQPVFLQVELVNRTGQPFNIPDWFLDPKGGALDIVVRRVSGSGNGGAASLWVPVMQRCYDVAQELADLVPDGGSVQRNLNLTFGAGGFAFAEPGEYEVQAVVSIPNPQVLREYIIPSNVLKIRVGYPRSREEEADALVILRGDVGLYFALGGSRALDRAGSDLEEVRRRRQGRARKITDPIVANIVRCQGIDAGRSYLRSREGEFVVDESNFEQAAELLEKLDDEALRAFDPDTAENTKKLAERHRRAVSA